MTARKGWLTPNAPLPSDKVCRRILIPADLQIIAAVNGALLELTKNYNWGQFGSASPEEVAEAMLSMYLDYVSEPCEGGGCRRIYRIGQGGQIERSDDAGETWESAADEIPPTPARTEPTEGERLCNAAANAVNVLHQTYEEMIDAWQLDSSVDFGIGAFATILGLLVGSWLGVVTAAAIPFVWELFGGVYTTIGTFLQDAWDSDFTEALTCLFQEAATDNEGVVTFDWNEISQGLADRAGQSFSPEDALLWAQLNYMVLFIGVEGLNAAGALTAVVGDCDNCSGDWSHVLTPENAGGLVEIGALGQWLSCDNVNQFGLTQPAGEVVLIGEDLVWRSTGRQGSTIATLGLELHIKIPEDTTVNRVFVSWSTIGGNPIIADLQVNEYRDCTLAGDINISNMVISGKWLHLYLRIAGNQAGTAPNYRVYAIQFFGTGRNPFS